LEWPAEIPYYDGAARVLAHMNHLGAGVGLLVVIGERNRIELADRVVAAQYTARIFPRDRRSGFNLRPRDSGIDAFAQAALRDKVVNTADTVRVARVPILHGRILDVGIVERNQFDHCRVQLVGVELVRSLRDTIPTRLLRR
jgi:hypothetical protein